MYKAHAILDITTDLNISKKHALSQIKRYNRFSDGNWMIVDKICDIGKEYDYMDGDPETDELVFNRYFCSAVVTSNIPIGDIAEYDAEYGNICFGVYCFKE